MIRATILLIVLAIGSACQSSAPTKKTLKECLDLAPYGFTQSLLRSNPIVTLANNTKIRFDELVHPICDSAYTLVVWASWCPPDTLPQANTPLVMLSIDQCTDAWRIATKQRSYQSAIHAQIDPYTAEYFLHSLGIYGIPHIVHIEP